MVAQDKLKQMAREGLAAWDKAEQALIDYIHSLPPLEEGATVHIPKFAPPKVSDYVSPKDSSRSGVKH